MRACYKDCLVCVILRSGHLHVVILNPDTSIHYSIRKIISSPSKRLDLIMFPKSKTCSRSRWTLSNLGIKGDVIVSDTAVCFSERSKKKEGVKSRRRHTGPYLDRLKGRISEYLATVSYFFLSKELSI